MPHTDISIPISGEAYDGRFSCVVCLPPEGGERSDSLAWDD